MPQTSRRTVLRWLGTASAAALAPGVLRAAAATPLYRDPRAPTDLRIEN